MTSVPVALLSARPLWGSRNSIVGLQDSQALTFDELLGLCRRLSCSLLEVVPPGRNVAIVGKSGVHFSHWLIATMFRHTVVPISPRLTAVEIERHLRATKTAVVVRLDVENNLSELEGDESLKIFDATVLEKKDCGQNVPGFSKPDSIAALLLTSGSSGQPKVVPLSHQNLVSAARDVISSVGLSPADRVLVLWAQHHIGGIVDLLLAPLLAGCEIVNGGEFSVPKMLRGLGDFDPTWAQFVPATLSETLRALGNEAVAEAPSSLRFIRCVAAPLREKLWRLAEEAFNCPLVHTYGMTEASPLVTSTGPSTFRRTVGSSGRPLSTRVRVMDSDGAPVSFGVAGRIYVAGPNVFSGYLGRERELQLVDGWFDTGDIGWLSESGELFVLGRESNQINRGGEKINPAEVEEVLASIEGVREVVVLGVEHIRLGHVPIAAISAERPISLEEIQKFARQRLAAFKIPADIIQLDYLPKNQTGKPDFPEILQAYKQRGISSELTQISSTSVLIQEVWDEELETRKIPTNVPFEIAGGDSLSAVRIVAELDRIFSLGPRATELMDMSTIDAMASYIDSIRNTQTSSPEGLVGAKAYRSGDNGLSVAEFSSEILSARSDVVRRTEWERALTHLTFEELLDLQSGVPPFDFGSRSWLFSPPRRRSDERTSWERKAVNPNLSLYQRTRTSLNGSENLLVFTSSNFRLLLPIHQILENIPLAIGSIAIVFDNHRDHYESGVTSIAHGIDGLGEGLVRLLGDHLVGVTRVLGASAGGLASLKVGLDLSAKSIGLIGPDRLSRHQRLEEALAKTIAERKHSGLIRVLSGRVPRDVFAVKELRKTIRPIRVRWLGRHHNALRTAALQGSLADQLRWLLAIPR